MNTTMAPTYKIVTPAGDEFYVYRSLKLALRVARAVGGVLVVERPVGLAA